ncbi:hypothetical protein BSKO_09450 [Bryopsis sp. KO-2023]|nr:hypothetical protein BSKO_09450 [Bryopsis sp. KO-2023]
MVDNVTKEVPDVIDDVELLRRAIDSFGEFLALVGEGVSPKSVVRRPDAVGARFDDRLCPNYFNSVVVPSNTPPPVEDPGSHYVWTCADAVAGRVADTDMVLPIMGVRLEDSTLNLDGAATNAEEPSLERIAAINFEAYCASHDGDALVARGIYFLLSIRDPRVRVYGLRVEEEFVCVAITLRVGEDLHIDFLATEQNYRRRGLACSLIKSILVNGRREGMRTATLLATSDGLPVYERVGFRRVGVIRAYVRPGKEIEILGDAKAHLPT